MSVIEFPQGPKERPPQPPESEDAKLKRLRHRAKTDLMWLANEVLGYDFQENPHAGLFKCYLKKDPDGCRCGHQRVLHHPFGAGRACSESGCECKEFQQKTLNELDKDIKRRLILWPRGHFKTSAAAVEMVQLILNYPDIRIMILAGDLKESIVRLEEVKGHFENWGVPCGEDGKDGKLHKLFPEFCSPIKGEKMGNKRKFVTPARIKKNLRQGTLEVFSPKVLKTGTHFDVAVIDDLVNELNCLTAEQLQKSIQQYKAVLPVIDPEGYVYVSGTRYDFSDCYGWIQETINAEGLKNWLVSVRVASKVRCAVKDCDHANFVHLDGGGQCSADGCKCQKFESSGVVEVLFPQVRTRDGKLIGFTPESLAKLRKELGPRDYGCQYENNPLVQEHQKFTRELLYSKVKPPVLIPTRGPVVIQIDIATGQEEKHDDMVIMSSRIRNGRHHLFDIEAGHIPEDRQPVVICDLIVKYAPRVIFIEKKTGAGYLETLIRMEAMRRKLRILPQIMLITPDNSKGAKNTRIGAILGYLTQDRVWFAYGMRNMEKLIQQLLVWPRSLLHDDLADCLGQLLQAPTGFEYDPLPEDPVPSWLREPKAEQESRPDREGLPFGLVG
jgi:hypothetical protein